MKKILIVCLFSFLYNSLFAFDGYQKDFKADIIHYEFKLRLNDSTDRIEGRALILARFNQESGSIAFDLANTKDSGKGMVVSGVLSDNKKVEWKHERDKLLIIFQRQAKTGDTLEFLIEYSGIPADGLIISRNKFGNRTFFADNWPDRAHNYLPCIDHPYDKASVDFIITAPSVYRIVASGILTGESDLSGNYSETHWSEGEPLATKVMAFGAARFATRLAGYVNNVPVWTWVFPENRNEGFSDYSVALKPLEFYSRAIGPYPYKKLANVQSRTIFGGLENAGTIFYSENSVTGSGKAEGLIAHEIAHQWFGDCVTEADWHHIWLSEGFATYLTSMYFESQQGRERLQKDMASSRTRIIKFAEKNTNPVIDTTITNLMGLLSVNSYQKGAWVLHMLRHELGDDIFMRGLKLFYTRFKNSNAVSSDFQKVMEEVSGMNLESFFYQWLWTGGRPELKIWSEPGKQKGTTVVCIEQEQEHLFEFSLDLKIRDQKGEKTEKAIVRERITKILVNATGDIAIVADPDVNLLFKQISLSN